MYICKIPTLAEMNQKWDYEIANAGDSVQNWNQWKQSYIAGFLAGRSIPYYGILDGEIISEATACIDPDGIQNAEGLIDGQTAYLCAFRTVPAFRKQGYFSPLFRYMMADLQQRGYQYATVGVEPEKRENLAIYTRYGFTEHIKRAEERYPDGTKILVDYYRKRL